VPPLPGQPSAKQPRPLTPTTAAAPCLPRAEPAPVDPDLIRPLQEPQQHSLPAVAPRVFPNAPWVRPPEPMPQPFGPSALRTTRVLTPPVASAMPTPRLPHQPPTAAAPHRGSRTSETRFRPAYATGAKALDLDANPRRGTARYGSCLPHRPNSCERRRKNPGATHAPVPLVLGCGRPVRSLPTICPCSNRRGPCDRCRVLPEPKPLVGNPSPRAPSHPFKYAGLTRHKLCRQHRSGAGVWPQIQDIPPELVAWRAISVLGPLWQGSCAGIAGASTLCAGRFPNPAELPP